MTAEGDPVEVAWRGIELCRKGEWEEGFYWLSLAADNTADTRSFPSQFFAYLGYNLALRDSFDQGLKLCRRAVDLELYQPENYLVLARVHLLAKDRRAAIEAIERGMQVDPSHEDLRRLRRELGERRSPVLPFLPRRHRLNRALGRVRHRLLGGGRRT